jgi:TetR/AcrR family transcriptional regulator, regulator of autoinduction and epiphytic fitness
MKKPLGHTMENPKAVTAQKHAGKHSDSVRGRPAARGAPAAVTSGGQSAVAPPRRPSFREQQFQAREDAILQVVNRMLSSKGYDLMTMDEVAAEVGIAKPSLYKHFDSKEVLAATAMTHLLHRTMEQIDAQAANPNPLENLKAVLRWALTAHLDGTMPLLPSTRSTIRQALINHAPYVEALIKVTDAFGGWIEAARKKGLIRKSAPTELVMFTMFARACDPTLEFLRETGQYTDPQIVEMMVQTCFEGLAA